MALQPEEVTGGRGLELEDEDASLCLCACGGVRGRLYRLEGTVARDHGKVKLGLIGRNAALAPAEMEEVYIWYAC